MLVPLLIRSPGSELRAESECRDVPIEIEGVGFLANLILLHSASLDVILGMDWLSQHMGHIDCARKVVYLTSPSGEQVGFSPKLQGPHLFALEAKPALEIHEVPTVCDFADVFPEDLRGENIREVTHCWDFMNLWSRLRVEGEEMWSLQLR